MAFKLSDNISKKSRELTDRYADTRAVLLPMIHELQKENGYISEEMIDALSGQLGVSRADIQGVVSFYSMYNRKPVGKFNLQVCRNLSCSLMGSEHIIDFLKKKLGIDEGETTKDGIFTLTAVECLGSCGTAPVVMINDDYYENLSVEKVEKLLEELKSGKTPA
jgi:NADH-quinone oxidoreductase E subunit